MPGRSRLFSETEMSSTSSLFKHITETMPLPKRRRGNDLNTRFDQMVQTMNVTHRSPPRRSRNRTRSNGSSSLSSYDYMPKTPLDAYDGLDAGSLGREFSVLKMKPSAYTDDEQDPDSPTTKLSSNPATKALPSWLATTFQGLNRDHPLRLLMPLSRRTSQQATSSDSVEENCPPELSDDEQPFAYLPPPPSIATHHDPSLVIIEDLTPAIDAAFVPFAKPGPASTLSPTWPTPVLPRIIQDVPPVRVQQPRTIFSPPAQLSLSYHDAPIQEPHSISPSYAHALPYTLASPYHAPTSPAAMPPPSSDIPVARYSDDPPVVHANIPNIYATPGPGYLASRPAYFDSPTEPPETSSSPIPFEDWAPNADFDPTELDFRWKPFDRTNRDVESPYDSAVGISLADMDVYAPSENDYVFEDEEEMIDVDVSEYADDAFASPGPDIFVESSVAVPDDGLFQFNPPSPSLPPSSTSAQSKEEEHVPSPPKPTSTPAPAPFMPAPGIYISPLRQPSPPVPVVADEKNPLTLLEKLDEVAEAPVISIKTKEGNTDEEKDELLSDSDTDTIESWD